MRIKFARSAVAASAVVGLMFSMAPSAHAASGNLTCPVSAKVAAHGSTLNYADAEVKVCVQGVCTPNHIGPKISVTLTGTTYSASWSVTGKHLSSAYAFCK